jgi:hypothetical protein
MAGQLAGTKRSPQAGGPSNQQGIRAKMFRTAQA